MKTASLLESSITMELEQYLRPVSYTHLRPTRSKYLGFTFLKNGREWKVRPTTEKKKKLRQKVSEYLKRNKAIAVSYTHLDVYKRQVGKAE